MKKMRFQNLAIFVIFFGLALVEAIVQHSWFWAVIFFVLGMISLWADIRNK